MQCNGPANKLALPVQPLQCESLERRALFTNVTGLDATYFDDANFGGTTQTVRVDHAVDFRWPAGTKPASGIHADTYSIRWTGRIKATTSETYRLILLSESPVRLWIGDKLVIDGWATTAKAVTYKGAIDLIANRRYDVEIELAHNTGPASVRFMWQTDSLVKQTVPSKLLTPQDLKLQSKINHAVVFARDQISRTLKDSPTPATAGYPEQTDAKGRWIVKPASGWTSGYFGGQLWQLDTYFGGGYQARATNWTTPIATESGQSGDHFSRLWDTFKPLFDKTGDSQYAQVLIDAANAKDAQFSAKIGGFNTPDIVSNSGNPNATFGLLMDQTLDLDLMFWASDRTGDARYRDHATKHLETVIANMVRSDGSVFQRYFFDGATGASIGGENYQGYSNSSTWSRGQAWAIYGFSRIAEITRRADFIAAARKVADYYVAHVPSDSVPYWDFNLPAGAKQFRDSSAAAIAARGLIRLSAVTGDASYRAVAARTLDSLTSPAYLSEGTINRGVLQHAALNVAKNIGNDVSLVFADYYFLESINAFTNRI